jgi:hypothetical protein
MQGGIVRAIPKKKPPALRGGLPFLAPGSTGGAPLRFLRSKRSEGSVAVVRDLVTARARPNKKPRPENSDRGFPFGAWQ